MQIKIYYVSVMGTNRVLAEEMAEYLRTDNTVTLDEMNNVDIFSVNKENTDLLILVPYTFNYGEIPLEALDFYDDLEDVTLEGVKTWVVGTGDSTYGGSSFAKSVDIFTERCAGKGEMAAPSLKLDMYPWADTRATVQSALDGMIK